MTAQLAVKDAGAGLFLGLGAIALLVGAIGIANVMVISVLERRTEIGLRRALGATRTHVAAQFLTTVHVVSELRSERICERSDSSTSPTPAGMLVHSRTAAEAG